MQTINNDFPFHHSSTAILQASADNAFSYLDDPKRLSSHMSESSWMMAGSKMAIELDEKVGHGIGAEIVLRGKMLGIPLFVREAVTDWQPAKRQAWETVGPQKMIIIGQYRMGFDLIPRASGVALRVFIDYGFPESASGRILGKIFAKIYAKWCTGRMAKDAAKHFNEMARISGAQPMGEKLSLSMGEEASPASTEDKLERFPSREG